MVEDEVNLIQRWVIQMGIAKVFDFIDGYKTYILAGFGILIALVGHFWGPVTVSGTTIPAQSWADVWKVVYASGIITFLRHGIQKSQDAAVSATPIAGGDRASDPPPTAVPGLKA